jgi:hypothetical protein
MNGEGIWLNAGGGGADVLLEPIAHVLVLRRISPQHMNRNVAIVVVVAGSVDLPATREVYALDNLERAQPCTSVPGESHRRNSVPLSRTARHSTESAMAPGMLRTTM